IGPPGQGVAVVAVVGDQVVVGAHLAYGADPDRLLADVEVEEAADLPLDVELGAALLEPSDEQHLAVEGQRLRSIHLSYSVPGKRGSSAYSATLRVPSTRGPALGRGADQGHPLLRWAEGRSCAAARSVQGRIVQGGRPALRHAHDAVGTHGQGAAGAR